MLDIWHGVRRWRTWCPTCTIMNVATHMCRRRRTCSQIICLLVYVRTYAKMRDTATALVRGRTYQKVRTMLHLQSHEIQIKVHKSQAGTSSELLLCRWVSTPDKFPFDSNINIYVFCLLSTIEKPPLRPRAAIVAPPIHHVIPWDHYREGWWRLRAPAARSPSAADNYRRAGKASGQNKTSRERTRRKPPSSIPPSCHVFSSSCTRSQARPSFKNRRNQPPHTRITAPSQHKDGAPR